MVLALQAAVARATKVAVSDDFASQIRFKKIDIHESEYDYRD